MKVCARKLEDDCRILYPFVSNTVYSGSLKHEDQARGTLSEELTNSCHICKQ